MPATKESDADSALKAPDPATVDDETVRDERLEPPSTAKASDTDGLSLNVDAMNSDVYATAVKVSNTKSGIQKKERALVISELHKQYSQAECQAFLEVFDLASKNGTTLGTTTIAKGSSSGVVRGGEKDKAGSKAIVDSVRGMGCNAEQAQSDSRHAVQATDASSLDRGGNHNEDVEDRKDVSKGRQEQDEGYISGVVKEAAEKPEEAQASKQGSADSEATLYVDRLRPPSRKVGPKKEKRRAILLQDALRLTERQAQASQAEQSAEGRETPKRKAESPPERARTKVPTTDDDDDAFKWISPAQMKVWKLKIRKVIGNWGSVSPVVITAADIKYVQSFIHRIKEGKVHYDAEERKSERIEYLIKKLADYPEVKGEGDHVVALQTLQKAARKLPSTGNVGEKDKPKSSAKKPRLG